MRNRVKSRHNRVLNQLSMMKISLLVAALICLSSGLLVAQSAGEQKNEPAAGAASTVAESTAADTTGSSSIKHLWIVGTTLGNNSSYLGRYQATRLPYYAADITYRNESGFWLSTTAYQVLGSASFIDEVDLMAGWNKNLSEKIDASVYYSRFFFSAESELLKASVANALNASAGLDWGYVYTKLSGSLLFGASTDFFLTIDNSRYWEKEKVLHEKDYVAFEPRFSVIAGTQTFVESHLINNLSPISPPVNPRGPGGGPGTGAEQETSTTAFNIMTYELSLPLSYTYHKTTLELAGRYTIPVNLLEGDPSTPQLFLTGSLYLAIY